MAQQSTEMSFSEIFNAGRDEMKDEVLHKINEVLNSARHEDNFSLMQMCFDLSKMVMDIPNKWEDSKADISNPNWSEEVSGIEVLK